MFYSQILTNVSLFGIGILGIIFSYKNVIVILMCLELILLSINMNLILISIYLDDFVGQVYSLYVLTVAASESSIGLAILIIYYRLRGNIYIEKKIMIKG
jgi:NADH-quinone oxidoreductase subunit K